MHQLVWLLVKLYNIISDVNYVEIVISKMLNMQQWVKRIQLLLSKKRKLFCHGRKN